VQLFWFGLTQRQEAAAGFDAATVVGGRLLILQFKASNHVLSTGERRFHVSHRQLEALSDLARPDRPRSVFYVFPDLGDTSDLSGGRHDILSRTWLLDVATLPRLGAPTKRNGTLRRNGVHYADLAAPWVTFHSDPVVVPVLSAEFGLPDAMIGAGLDPEAAASTFLSKRLYGRGAVGVVLGQPSSTSGSN
jgi:hypothetical protein